MHPAVRVVNKRLEGASSSGSSCSCVHVFMGVFMGVQVFPAMFMGVQIFPPDFSGRTDSLASAARSSLWPNLGRALKLCSCAALPQARANRLHKRLHTLDRCYVALRLKHFSSSSERRWRPTMFLMTQARRLSVFPDRPGFYHCMTRCVRQAFLFDTSGPCTRDYADRRTWIEQRLFELCDSFAVGLFAWAAMSNHCHVVLLVDPLKPRSWSDEEVAAKWCRITQFPGRRVEPSKLRQREAALLKDARRLAEIRERLGSLSWFMRFLNEGIARRANREDGCKGHFWDGRFKSQNLLDDRAALAAMVYVDLNPVRAGVAQQLSDSVFTSVRWRLQRLAAGRDALNSPFTPIAGSVDEPRPSLRVMSYLRLITWTGRRLHHRHRGRLRPWPPNGLITPGNESEWWLRVASGLEEAFACFVGTPGNLKRMAKHIGRRWLRGGQRTSTLPIAPAKSSRN